jgi:mRNA interferase MazF
MLRGEIRLTRDTARGSPARPRLRRSSAMTAPTRRRRGWARSRDGRSSHQQRRLDPALPGPAADRSTRLRVDSKAQFSKAQAEQVCSISVHRQGALLRHVPTPLMARLDDALRLHLQL